MIYTTLQTHIRRATLCGVAIVGGFKGEAATSLPSSSRVSAESPVAGIVGPALPSSSLSVRDAQGRWQPFWSSDRAPARWESAPLTRYIRWTAGAHGFHWGEAELAGSGEAWRTRLIVARLDPAQLAFRLDTAFTENGSPDWSTAKMPRDAVLAINAGQFEMTMPWGWVVLGGRKWLSPQPGPLSAALAQDATGALRWVHGNDVARFSARTRGVRWAFQSYPALLVSDTIPAALRGAGRGVDVKHRDARAAICMDRDSRLVIAMTRFDGMGSALGFIPFGLTTPEMAAVMGALGCRDAMSLDGGISAQMVLRDGEGQTRSWKGVRKVPLALVAMPSVGTDAGVTTRPTPGAHRE